MADWLPPAPSPDIPALDSAAAPAALGVGGLFWETSGVTVRSVVPLDADHATVVLSGPLTWCLGSGPSDPTAACTDPYGVGQSTVAFPAVRLGDAWYIDVRCNNGSELSLNPGAQ